MSKSADGKTYLEIFLVKDGVVIAEEVKPENPDFHGVVSHDTKLAHSILLIDVTFLGHEVVDAINSEGEVWETRVELLIITEADRNA